MQKILLIIPAYNEEASILRVCQSIQAYNTKHHTHYDFIVINDASTDHTKQILEQHHLPHINHIYNLGIGGAMQTGYKYAKLHGYDTAIQFDGDGQHDIDSVPDILQPITTGVADMVIGSRFITKSGRFRSTFARRIGIKVISNYMYFLTHKRISDTTSGFRAVNRQLIEQFADSYPSEYPEPVTTTLCLLNKHRVIEIPVEMSARMGGRSSIHTWKNIYYMVNIIVALFVVKVKRRY